MNFIKEYKLTRFKHFLALCSQTNLVNMSELVWNVKQSNDEEEESLNGLGVWLVKSSVGKSIVYMSLLALYPFNIFVNEKACATTWVALISFQLVLMFILSVPTFCLVHKVKDATSYKLTAIRTLIG